VAERKYSLPENGTEVQKDDLDLLGETAAYADDRLIWELYRTVPGSATPQKFLLPYGVTGWADPGLNSTALVNGETADGKVRVMPFRCGIGSTTLLAPNNVKKHLRDVRTAYHVGASTLHTEVAIAANAAGDPRWTLVYATITPDANEAGVTRYKKDPSSKIITSSSVSVSKLGTVVINTVDGAAAASPTRPALPADGGGSYNIPLAFIWVPNGFGAGSTVGRGQIHEVAPCLPLHSTTGALTSRPANQAHVTGGAIDANQGHNQALRPGAYLPPTMIGAEHRIILVQNGLVPLSYADGDTVDDTIDWRYRFFQWFAHVRSGSTAAAAFASDRNLTGSSPAGSAAFRTIGGHVGLGFGQSFVDDAAAMIAVANCQGVAMFASEAEISQLGANDDLQLYVDSTNGALKLKKAGAGTYQAIIHLFATAPYSNFGTV